MKTLITSFMIMTAVITVLTLLLYAFARIFGTKVSAKCRYVLWCALIVEMCLPLPLISTVIDKIPQKPVVLSAPAEPISVYASGVLDSAEKTFTYAPAPITDTSGIKAQTSDTIPPQDVSQPAAEKVSAKTEKTNKTPIRISPLYAAFFIWAAGAFAMLTYSSVRYAKFLRTVRILRKREICLEADEETKKLLIDACRDLKIETPPVLLVTYEPVSPILFGYFRPVILIPVCGMTKDGISAVISHELVHYKRHDLAVKLLSCVAVSAFWFDPAAYLAVREAKREAELSCDDAVLSGKTDEYRVAYGETMLDVVKRCRKSNIPMTSAFNSSGEKGAKTRFMNILNGKNRSGGKALIALILAVCIVTGTFVACTGYKPGKEEDAKTEITYDENGVPILVPEKLTYTFNNYEDTKTYEVDFSYDGSKIMADRKVNDQEDFHFEFETDGGKLQKFSVYRVEDGENILCNVLTKTWDGDDLIEEKYTDGDGNIRYTYKYEYSGGNLVKEVLDHRPLYGTIDTKTYEYDGEGRLLKEVSEVTDERTPDDVNTIVREYTYGEDGSRKTTINGKDLTDGGAVYFDRNGNIEKATGNGTTLEYLYDENGRFTGLSENHGCVLEIKYYEGTDHVIHTEFKGDGSVASYNDFDPEKMLFKCSDGTKIKWKPGTKDEMQAVESIVACVDANYADENNYFISDAWEQFVLVDAGLFSGGPIEYSDTPEMETVNKFVKGLFSATPEEYAEHAEIIYRAGGYDGETGETGIVSADSKELSDFVMKKLENTPTDECLEKIIAERMYYKALEIAKKRRGEITVSDLELDKMESTGKDVSVYKFYADVTYVEYGRLMDTVVGTITLIKDDSSWKVSDVSLVSPLYDTLK